MYYIKVVLIKKIDGIGVSLFVYEWIFNLQQKQQQQKTHGLRLTILKYKTRTWFSSEISIRREERVSVRITKAQVFGVLNI